AAVGGETGSRMVAVLTGFGPVFQAIVVAVVVVQVVVAVAVAVVARIGLIAIEQAIVVAIGVVRIRTDVVFEVVAQAVAVAVYDRAVVGGITVGRVRLAGVDSAVEVAVFGAVAHAAAVRIGY